VTRRRLPRMRYPARGMSITRGHEIQAERELMRKPYNPLVVLIAKVLRIPLLPRTAPPRGGPSHMHAVNHPDDQLLEHHENLLEHYEHLLKHYELLIEHHEHQHRNLSGS